MSKKTIDEQIGEDIGRALFSKPERIFGVILLFVCMGCCLTPCSGSHRNVSTSTIHECSMACGELGMREVDDRHCVCGVRP